MGNVGTPRQGCVFIAASGSSIYEGVQLGEFSGGVTAQSTGAGGLCLHTVALPPHTRGNPHLHAGHESAIYIVSGRIEVWHGPGFAHRTPMNPGDMVYIPPDEPHMPVTFDEPLLAVVARTDPNEQESVVILPDPEPPVSA